MKSLIFILIAGTLGFTGCSSKAKDQISKIDNRIIETKEVIMTKQLIKKTYCYLKNGKNVCKETEECSIGTIVLGTDPVPDSSLQILLYIPIEPSGACEKIKLGTNLLVKRSFGNGEIISLKELP